MLAYVVTEGRLFALNPSDWAMLLVGVALCGLPILGPANERAAVTLKFISAVIAAAAFAGVLTLLWATSTRLDAGPARDAAPQSTPVTPTAPALAEAAISPALVRLDEVVRDLAVMRNSVEQLAAKQEQMAQTIATRGRASRCPSSRRPSSRRPNRTSYRRGHPRLCPSRSRPRRAKKREGLRPGNSPRSHRLRLPRRSVPNNGYIQASFVAHHTAFLVSARKSRGGGHWDKDDYDVRLGHASGPVAGRIMRF